MPDVGLTVPETEAYLVNLNVEAVALCNQGANTRAHILLTKRRESNTMTLEEILKAMKPEDAAVIKTQIDNDAATHAAALAELQGKLDEALKAKPVEKPEGDDGILKNATPELAGYIKGLQDTLNTLVADKAQAEANERYQMVKSLPVEEEKLKEVLKTISPATFEILKVAANAVDAAALTAKGTSGGDKSLEVPESRDAFYAILEKSARTIMAESTDTFEQAFVKACELDPGTYLKYSKGV